MRGGLFVTLYDEDTLKLYLDRGIYGQLLSPERGKPSSYSAYYPTLADYSCIREGDHVFFFLKRKIYYAGQIIGSKEVGSFYLNGQKTPLGRKANAPLVWNESKREIYGATDEEGVFYTKEKGENKRCQPFLILFRDQQDLAGTFITSDQLYLRLGEYPYPLPSNSISGVGFCTLTPGETKILLELLKNEAQGKIATTSKENIELKRKPIPFSPDYLVKDLTKAKTESHLEAIITANPSLLPPKIQPKNAVICRQVPISPFKPNNMDRADVCYFEGKEIRKGTIPDTVIELKNKKAGKGAIMQVIRYLKWIEKLKKSFDLKVEKIDMYLYAPDFTRTVEGYIPERFENKIQLLKFGGK